jgi:hypothetical protein
MGVRRERMRRLRVLFAVMMVVLAWSCSTKPPLRKGEVLIEDKGTAMDQDA